MTAPIKPWESTLQNNGQILRNTNIPIASASGMRSAPVLPPRPHGLSSGYNSSYSPYSSYGNSYGYGSMPYRSSVFGGSYGSGYGSYGSNYGGYGSSYGGYGGMYGSALNNGYNNYAPGGFGMTDDAEGRFIQYAEESSRNTFSNVESIVRAFNSLAMMLDNTFFAMTSSFRAILGVAENFGRLRTTFGHIWHAVNIFRLFTWLYRKMLRMAGVKVADTSKSLAWNEAMNGAAEVAGSHGSSWPTFALLGVLMSAPYFISKFLPKFEDKQDPAKWKSSGIPAKAVFDFASSAPNELSLHMNDEILLAPKTIQEEMKLTNSGWAYATCNGRSGVVPLNYIVVVKKVSQQRVPIPQKPQKRVSFGEDQIFEDKGDIFNNLSYKSEKEDSSRENCTVAQSAEGDGVPIVE